MGRSPCCEKNGLKKGPWTPEEDHILITYIQKHGHGSWRTLPKNAGLARCGKSCRLRWTNYLRPDIKRGRFSFDEEETIIQLHSILGNKWSAIAARLPGRTDNEIKNYWNTHIRKRLLRMGIDPVTHSPRLDLLDLSSLLTNPAFYSSNISSNNNSNNSSIPSSHFELISRLVGVENLVSPADQLLRYATNLLASNNAFFNNDQSQIMQPNMYATGDQSNDLLQPNGAQFDYSDGFLPANSTAGYAIQHDRFLSAENSNAYVQNNVLDHYNLNATTSVLSTPISSPATQLNSSSMHNVNSGTEDERDSFCSDLFNFQIPSLLDASDFM